MDNLPNIEPFRQRYNELETILSDAEIFKDPIQASKLSREHGRLKLILECNQNILDHQCQITDFRRSCWMMRNWRRPHMVKL